MATYGSYREYQAKVLEANDLLTVLKEYGVTPKVGLMAHCPFHADDRPSFSIILQPRRGGDPHFNCHGAGCGKAGDVAKFVSLMDGTTYAAALDKLAERVGLQPYRPHAGEVREEELRQQVLAITEFASHYYRWRWNTAATEYLCVERRLPVQLVDRFRLGYADGGFVDYLLKEWGATWGPVIAFAGLADERRRPGAVSEYRDRFRDRLMFPVFVQDRAVFLSGRSLDGSDPKYLHQKGYEAPLYNEDALNPKEVTVVEGPVDTLSLEAWDYPTVGFQGGMRESAVAKLRRVKTVYTCLDADKAGIAATLKMAAALGDQLKCITLPAGLDPNDFYRTRSKTEFEDLRAQATDPVRFALGQVPFDLPPERLSFALEPVLRLLAAYPPLTSDAYLETVLAPRYEWTRRGLQAARSEVDAYREAATQACPACGARLVTRRVPT